MNHFYIISIEMENSRRQVPQQAFSTLQCFVCLKVTPHSKQRVQRCDNDVVAPSRNADTTVITVSSASPARSMQVLHRGDRRLLLLLLSFVHRPDQPLLPQYTSLHHHLHRILILDTPRPAVCGGTWRRRGNSAGVGRGNYRLERPGCSGQ